MGGWQQSWAHNTFPLNCGPSVFPIDSDIELSVRLDTNSRIFLVVFHMILANQGCEPVSILQVHLPLPIIMAFLRLRCCCLSNLQLDTGNRQQSLHIPHTVIRGRPTNNSGVYLLWDTHQTPRILTLETKLLFFPNTAKSHCPAALQIRPSALTL